MRLVAAVAVAIVLVLVVGVTGASHAARLRADDASTRFVWSGTVEVDEAIWLRTSDSCPSGPLKLAVHQALNVVKRAYLAQVNNPRKGIWEMQIEAVRAGVPSVGVRGSITCNGQHLNVSNLRVKPGYGKTVALTLRYDARKQKLEIVPHYESGAFLITGDVSVPGFSGRESVIADYGLPRLEFHPVQETDKDFRTHVEQRTGDPNALKIRNAKYVRAYGPGEGTGGFGGSPITTFLGFQGHSGGLGPGYQYDETVDADQLRALVIGPDSDGDRVNDGADPNAFDADSDNDGFPDYWEAQKGTDPNDKNDHPSGRCCPGAPDSDGDGHSDPQEVAGGSDPNDPASVPKAAADGSGGTSNLPPPPSEEWYGFKIVSNRCVNDGETADGAPMAHARVVLHMWVITKSGLTSTHLVTHMRWRARLELPIGYHYDQAWAGGQTPYLIDGRHDIDATINTVQQIRDATTDGGQPWRVHVQLTWDRPSLTDINRNLFLPFNTANCLSH